MKKVLPYIIGIFYILFLMLTLAFENDLTYNYFMKPVLVPLLLIYALLHKPFREMKLFVFALLFSTSGDVCLMFSDAIPIFFILGLASFLVGHVFYIFVFKKLLGSNYNRPVLYISTIVIGIYLASFLSLMWDHLGELQIPVVVYATIISTMLWMAIQIYAQKNIKTGNYIFWGALFFVISDSMLAFNMFYQKIPHQYFFVMTTYLLAQVLLTRGVIERSRNHPATLQDDSTTS